MTTTMTTADEMTTADITATALAADVFARLAALDAQIASETFLAEIDGNSGVEFGVAFTVDAHGAVRTDAETIAPLVYAISTDADIDADSDAEFGADFGGAPVVTLDPTDLVANEWSVMAAGEDLAEADQIMEGSLGRRILSRPGTYMVVETQDATDLDLTFGWALLVRG